MAFDANNTPSDDSHLEGVRRLAERVEKKAAWFNELTKAAKGGNPNKLISPRDVYPALFADIDAAFRRGQRK